ncbi:hypothetical protein MCOR25_004373 [Pyricularia grisea]|nr:hypothetical protein MCOR25_004373 [Pyricularia grisea]
MQTSFTTIVHLMVALLASSAVAAPLTTTENEKPRLLPRLDSRCADEGYGCNLRCYPNTDVCGWVAIPPPSNKATTKREEINAAAEV